MLALSAEALAMVQRSYTMRIRAESWLGSQLLAQDVPVAAGTETVDRSLSVPETVSLTIPRLDRGVTWDPLITDHPLGSFGQRLRISFGVDTGFGTEWIERGWFLITKTSRDGDNMTVDAAGLLTLIDEAKFVSPYEPSGTFVSTVRGLVEPALTVSIDGALTDRSVPVGMHWDEDRLGALFELLDAWPATAAVSSNGVLQITAPVTTISSPVVTLTDGLGGTVVRWQGETTREGGFNVVVAKGENSNGDQIIGTAYDTAGTSPLRIAGNFNPLPVPFVFASPLLSTVAQCRAAAATILERKRRTATRKITATLVPHPGLVAGDVAALTGAGFSATPASIEQMTLPYTPGPMTVNLVT